VAATAPAQFSYTFSGKGQRGAGLRERHRAADVQPQTSARRQRRQPKSCCLTTTDNDSAPMEDALQ